MGTERDEKVQRAWARALELERNGQIEEAEELIVRAIDHLGAYSQVAHMHQLRMERLMKEGDRAGAIEAFEKSNQWMRVMASGATSGGEGAALSLAADDHRKELVGILGFDPG